MDGQTAVASLTQEPARFAAVSRGIVAGTPLLAFGYSDDPEVAFDAATHLHRSHAVPGEIIFAVAAESFVIEPMPAERLALVGIPAGDRS